LVSLADGQTVSGTLVMKGTAKEDGAVRPNYPRVEVSVDGGLWQNASGTTTWQFTVQTENLPDGVHRIKARACDPIACSAEDARTVYVNNHPTENNTRIVDNICLALLATTAILMVATVVTRIFVYKKAH